MTSWVGSLASTSFILLLISKLEPDTLQTPANLTNILFRFLVTSNDNSSNDPTSFLPFPLQSSRVIVHDTNSRPGIRALRFSPVLVIHFRFATPAPSSQQRIQVHALTQYQFLSPSKKIAVGLGTDYIYCSYKHTRILCHTMPVWLLQSMGLMLDSHRKSEGERGGAWRTAPAVGETRSICNTIELRGWKLFYNSKLSGQTTRFRVWTGLFSRNCLLNRTEWRWQIVSRACVAIRFNPIRWNFSGRGIA